MCDTMNIRQATKIDIDQFKELIKESILVSCDAYYSREQFSASEVYEKWIHGRLLLVAEKNGDIVGFAQYSPDISLIGAVHVKPSNTQFDSMKNVAMDK